MNAQLATTLGTVLTISIAILTGLTQGEDAPGGVMAAAKLDSTTLRVQEPVNLEGPSPNRIREVEEGDVIQIRIAYPVGQALPVEAVVKSSTRAISILFVTSNEDEIAVGPDPKRGVIGSRYFSAYLRANNATPDTKVFVTAIYPNKTRKDVSFNFRITPRSGAKRARSVSGNRYYNPPAKVYEVGRPIESGTYPELLKRLQTDEVLIAMFRNQQGALVAAEVPSRERFDELNGIWHPIAYYAVCAAEAERGFGSL